jgi:hypothetical protein
MLCGLVQSARDTLQAVQDVVVQKELLLTDGPRIQFADGWPANTRDRTARVVGSAGSVVRSEPRKVEFRSNRSARSLAKNEIS